jgi:hypothetical protein
MKIIIAGLQFFSQIEWYSQQVTIVVRGLGEQGAALRRAIESLKQNPVPDWARPLPDRPGGYEWLVAGYWVMYEVDQSNLGETVIRVVRVKAN